MVPDKFDMVDMGGIDLIESQGVAVDGLYQKLVESITLCRYQCLYNWKFNGILIPPSYVEMEVRHDSVWINEGVSVDEEDVIHIYTIEPEPPAPIQPTINPISITENGEYTAPEGVDGYSPITVSVASGSSTIYGNSVPSNSIGSDGDWYIQENEFARINSLGFDTGIDVTTVYGFKFIFKPYRGVTGYQSYLLATLDDFTVGRTGNIDRVYVRIRNSERLTFTFNDLITLKASDGRIVGGGSSAQYDANSSLGSSGNVVIGAKISDRYSDFLFNSLELYDIDGNTIDYFYYNSDENKIVGRNGELTPSGSWYITPIDEYVSITAYHKENNIWIPVVSGINSTI